MTQKNPSILLASQSSPSAILAIIYLAAHAADNAPAVGVPLPISLSIRKKAFPSASTISTVNGWSFTSIPKDFTSGCTIEAHNFQRDIAKYQEKGAVIRRRQCRHRRFPQAVLRQRRPEL